MYQVQITTHDDFTGIIETFCLSNEFDTYAQAQLCAQKYKVGATYYDSKILSVDIIEK